MGDRHSSEQGHRGRRHRPPGGRVRSFIQPRLLFLLARKPAHGYELMEQLDESEAVAVDPGLLYRTLRRFQAQGFVSSTWDTGGSGAARRVYEITPEGLDYLHAWVADIRRTRQRLDLFLEEYEHYFEQEGR